MKKSITKNYLYNLTSQILIIIIPLILAPYLTRVLGAENLGVYSYTLSISAYFILFGTLGISMYAKREIAYVQKDKNLVSKNFWEIIILKIICMIISLTIFYITFANGNGQYNIYFKILILELIANMIDISWFFEGMELFKKTVLRNIIIKFISIIAIFCFVKTGQDFKIYFLIYVISMMVGNLSLWLSLPKYINKYDIKKLEFKKHLKPILGLFIPQIAIQLYTVLDRTMIGIMIEDKSHVGFYDQSQRLIGTVLTVVTALGGVMLPRISNEFSEGNFKKIKEYIFKSLNFVFLLTIPIIFGILLVSKYFIPLYLGDDFSSVVVLINILSLIIIFIGLSNVIGIQYLLPTKKQKWFTISVFVGAIINFIFNLILITKIGTIGACIATGLAEGMVLVTQFYLVRKDFKVLDILKIGKNYFISSSIMYSIITICNRTVLISLSDLAKCLINGILGVTIYVTFLILIKDKLVIGILNKILKRKKELK